MCCARHAVVPSRSAAQVAGAYAGGLDDMNFYIGNEVDRDALI